MKVLRVVLVALVFVASACNGGNPTAPVVQPPTSGGRAGGPAPLVIDQVAQASWDALPSDVKDYIRGKYSVTGSDLVRQNCTSGDSVVCDDTYTVALWAEPTNRYYGEPSVGGIHDVELDVWRSAFGAGYSFEIVSSEHLADTVLRNTDKQSEGGACAYAQGRRNVLLAFAAPGCVDGSGRVPNGSKIHEIGHTLGLPHTPASWGDVMLGVSPDTMFRISDGLQKAIDFLKQYKGKAIKIVG